MTVTLAAHLTVAEKRCAVALALAHHALGHRGNSHQQDIDARRLAVGWLITEQEMAEAVRAVGIDFVTLSEHLNVTHNAVRIALGLVCERLSNWQGELGMSYRCGTGYGVHHGAA